MGLFGSFMSSFPQTAWEGFQATWNFWRPSNVSALIQGGWEWGVPTPGTFAAQAGQYGGPFWQGLVQGILSQAFLTEVELATGGLLPQLRFPLGNWGHIGAGEAKAFGALHVGLVQDPFALIHIYPGRIYLHFGPQILRNLPIVPVYNAILSLFSVTPAEGAEIAPNGGAPPQVGGILFENCDAILTGVGEITGAYWDGKTGSLVLVGKDGYGGPVTSMGLPAMDSDHLAVALRSSLAGQAMGVSIDPESKYRDGIMRGNSPPDGTPMLVSYLGNTEGTLFGSIMFEADRLLKCLDKGVDNETRKPLERTVPGFKPLLEMIHPADGRHQNVWHRFWFIIDKVELKRDPVSGAIAFGDVRVKVLTETELEGQANGQYVDPADEAFVRHLTDNYDNYAKAFPILSRLKELAKVAAVAKFLVNQGTPLNIEALVTLPPVFVKATDSTPGISVTSPNVEITRRGNVVQTRTVSLFGGVDLDADPYIIPDDGTAKHLRDQAESSRPSPLALSWSFGKNGSASRALSSKIAASNNPFRIICNDHEFALGRGEGSLRLRRAYDSSSYYKGDFGAGWSLWVPYSMTVIPPSGKRLEVLTRQELAKRETNPVLVLHDRGARQSSIYRFVSTSSTGSRAAFCRITSQTRNGKEISFKYDPSDCIWREGDCFILVKDGISYSFDSKGQLLEVRKDNMCLARYVRENSHIVRITDGFNQSYDIHYEASEAGRIVEIITSSGSRMVYSYDAVGLLKSCQGGKCPETYNYDSSGLLTEVRAQSSQVISRAVYNGFGDVVKTGSDIITDWAGGRVMRVFDQGRVVSLKDESGSSQHFRYGNQGEVKEIKIKDRYSGAWLLGYDSIGRLSSFQDSSGHKTLLQYDDSGRVTKCIGPRGASRTYTLDKAGRLTSVADQNGRQWTLKYDRVGNVSEVKGPGDMHWDYEYTGGRLAKICTPTGEVKIKPSKDILEMKAVVASGMWHESAWDRFGRPVQYQAQGAKSMRFQYDDERQAFSTLSESGIVRCQVDNDDLSISVAFEDA